MGKLLPPFFWPFLIVLLTSSVFALPTITTIDSQGGSFPSLVLDSNGNPVVGYSGTGSSKDTRSFKIVVCKDATCSPKKVTVNTVVDNIDTHYTNPHTFLILDKNNYPVISYFSLYEGGWSHPWYYSKAGIK